jgi:DNA-binding transcriptional regulator YiaG
MVHEESPDGAVRIVLTASGRLDRITLRPWAMELGAERLADVITETIRRAQRDVPTGREFGEMVRAFRRGAGLSQDQLAARAGLGVRGLRKIETRQVSSPRPATVLLLADALGPTGHERERFFAAAVEPR